MWRGQCLRPGCIACGGGSAYGQAVEGVEGAVRAYDQAVEGVEGAVLTARL